MKSLFNKLINVFTKTEDKEKLKKITKKEKKELSKSLTLTSERKESLILQEEETDKTLQLTGETENIPSDTDKTLALTENFEESAALYHDEEDDFVKEKEESVPAEWKEGDIILGMYEVTSILGQGAMGKVYKVRHLLWNEDLAVKSPKEKVLSMAGGAKNFEREAETWVNLGIHPNIVSCYYVRCLGNIPRVFAEYIDGWSLSGFIREGRIYEGGKEKALERILTISIEFASGLSHAHKKGLVHQDVKPANVMITKEGTAKVTDFGLARAKIIDDKNFSAGPGETITVKAVGLTPEYCSPEQALGKKLSRKTDIWSWAVSVLEMFTGGVTWRGGQLAGMVLENHLNQKSQDDTVPEMPEELGILLRKCFINEPEKRPESFEVIEKKLTEIYKSITGKKYTSPDVKEVTLQATALNNKGVSLYDLGKREEALQAFTEALKRDPSHPEAVYNQTMLLWHKGEITDLEAIEKVNPLKTSHQEDFRPHYFLGLIHMARKDYEEAKTNLEKALAASPGEIELEQALKKVITEKQKEPRLIKNIEENFPINSVAITGDGKRAIIGGYYKGLKFLNIDRGKTIHNLEGHKDTIYSVAISPDGKFALSGSTDNTLKYWDLEKGNEIFTAINQSGGKLRYQNTINNVAFFPGGNKAITGDYNCEVKIWDLAKKDVIKSIRKNREKVTAVAISPDEKYALSGDEDNTIILWDINTEKIIRELYGHRDKIKALAFSPDGNYALSGGESQLILWDIKKKKSVKEMKAKKLSVSTLAFLPDGKYAVSGARSSDYLRIWHISTGQCLRSLKSHKSASLSLSEDGKTLLSGGYDKTLQVWYTGNISSFTPSLILARIISHKKEMNIQKTFLSFKEDIKNYIKNKDWHSAFHSIKEARALPGYERHPELMDMWAEVGKRFTKKGLNSFWHVKTFEGHKECIKSLHISSDSRLLVSASQDKTVRLWDIKTGKNIHILKSHEEVAVFASFTPDDKFIISGSTDNILCIWDVNTGKCVRKINTGEYKPPEYPMTALSDGRLVIAGKDELIRIGNLMEPDKMIILKGHTKKVKAVIVTDDEKFALSSGEDRTVRLWEIKTGRCLKTTNLDVNSIFLPSGKSPALLKCEDGTLKKWDTETGEVKTTPKGHTSFTWVFALSPDGNFLLTGSYDKRICYWNINTGECILEMSGTEKDVTALAFSPDGKFALSGSHDKILRYWDLSTGNCIASMKGQEGSISSVSFSPNGKFAATSNGDQFSKGDRTIKYWDLSGRTCIATLKGHQKGVREVKIFPDGRFMLSASEDSTLKLWDLEDGKCLCVMEGHPSRIETIAVSRDGRFGASGDWDNKIRLWEFCWDYNFS